MISTGGFDILLQYKEEVLQDALIRVLNDPDGNVPRQIGQHALLKAWWEMPALSIEAQGRATLSAMVNGGMRQIPAGRILTIQGNIEATNPFIIAIDKNGTPILQLESPSPLQLNTFDVATSYAGTSAWPELLAAFDLTRETGPLRLIVAEQLFKPLSKLPLAYLPASLPLRQVSTSTPSSTFSFPLVKMEVQTLCHQDEPSVVTLATSLHPTSTNLQAITSVLQEQTTANAALLISEEGMNTLLSQLCQSGKLVGIAYDPGTGSPLPWEWESLTVSFDAGSIALEGCFKLAGKVNQVQARLDCQLDQNWCLVVHPQSISADPLSASVLPYVWQITMNRVLRARVPQQPNKDPHAWKRLIQCFTLPNTGVVVEATAQELVLKRGVLMMRYTIPQSKKFFLANKPLEPEIQLSQPDIPVQTVEGKAVQTFVQATITSDSTPFSYDYAWRKAEMEFSADHEAIHSIVAVPPPAIGSGQHELLKIEGCVIDLFGQVVRSTIPVFYRFEKQEEEEDKRNSERQVPEHTGILQPSNLSLQTKEQVANSQTVPLPVIPPTEPLPHPSSPLPPPLSPAPSPPLPASHPRTGPGCPIGIAICLVIIVVLCQIVGPPPHSGLGSPPPTVQLELKDNMRTIDAHANCIANSQRGWTCSVTIIGRERAQAISNRNGPFSASAHAAEKPSITWHATSSGLNGITFEPERGTLYGGEETTIIVTIPGTACPPASQVLLNFHEDTGSKRSLPVNWTCENDKPSPPPDPQLVMEPASFDVQRQCKLATDQSFWTCTGYVKNEGKGPGQWSVQTKTTMRIQPAQGILKPNEKHSVSFILTPYRCQNGPAAFRSEKSIASVTFNNCPTEPPSPLPEEARLCNVNDAINLGQMQEGQRIGSRIDFGNCGGQPLQWSAQRIDGWNGITLNQSSGSLAARATGEIFVTATSNTGERGNHIATILLTTNGGEKRIKVSLTVLPPPPPAAKLCQVNNIDLSKIEAGKSKSGAITFKNCGGQSLQWSAQRIDGWSGFTIEQSRGTLAAGATGNISVTAMTRSGDQGKHTATILLTTNGGEQRVTVSLTIVPPEQPPAQLCKVEGADLGQVEAGKSAGGTISFSNCGGQLLSWQIQSDGSPWLKIGNESGTTEPNLTTTINIAGIASAGSAGQEGKYTAVVTISPAGGQPLEAVVTMHVVKPVVPAQLCNVQGLDLGTLQTGESKSGVITFSNCGGESLKWIAKIAHGTWNGVTIHTPDGSVPPNNNTGQIHVTATADAGAGPRSAIVRIITNVGEQQASVTLTVAAQPVPAQPVPVVQPPQLCNVQDASLGTLKQGQDTSGAITFKNCGGQPLHWSAQHSGGWNGITLSGAKDGIVDPGASGTIPVTVTTDSSTPDTAYSATILISTNGGEQQAKVFVTVVYEPG